MAEWRQLRAVGPHSGCRRLSRGHGLRGGDARASCTRKNATERAVVDRFIQGAGIRKPSFARRADPQRFLPRTFSIPSPGLSHGRASTEVEFCATRVGAALPVRSRSASTGWAGLRCRRRCAEILTEFALFGAAIDTTGKPPLTSGISAEIGPNIFQDGRAERRTLNSIEI